MKKINQYQANHNLSDKAAGSKGFSRLIGIGFWVLVLICALLIYSWLTQ